MDNSQIQITDLIKSIEHWNEYRVPILRITLPDRNLHFHGAMRFYFQDAGQKVATKCVNVTSSDTTKDVIMVLIEKFRPDMRMLSVPEYGLYEIHENGDERKLEPNERPLFVQLEWNKDDREGRFLLRRMDERTRDLTAQNEERSLKRKASKKEKKREEKLKKQQQKELDKAEKLASKNNKNGIAERLYNELPETSFTRSISNPEAVMKRRRAQKLEKRLQEFSLKGGQETGGTLRIFGEAINKDVSYKTLLLSCRDTASFVVKQILEKYGETNEDPSNYCLVQLIVPHSAASGGGDNSVGLKEFILEDHECPLSIHQNHDKSTGVLTFHIRHRPADYRRKPSRTRSQISHPSPIQNGQQQLNNHHVNNHHVKNHYMNNQNVNNHNVNNHNVNNHNVNNHNMNNHHVHNQRINAQQVSNQSVNNQQINHHGGMPPPPIEIVQNGGAWTVHFKNDRPDVPEVIIIQLRKKNELMGLSIIAAKGEGQECLGIYIKSVVKDGAAAIDGRLEAGDQLLAVDGNSLLDVTQEEAAQYIACTGPIVTLKVAKQAAISHNVSDIIYSVPSQNMMVPHPNLLPPPSHSQNFMHPSPIMLEHPIQPQPRQHPHFLPNQNMMTPQMIHQNFIPPPPIIDHTQQSQQQNRQQQQQGLRQHLHFVPSQPMLTPQVMPQNFIPPPPYLDPLQQPIRQNSGTASKSPKKVSWVDNHPHQSLHTLIPPSPALQPSPTPLEPPTPPEVPSPPQQMAFDFQGYENHDDNSKAWQLRDTNPDYDEQSQDSATPPPTNGQSLAQDQELEEQSEGNAARTNGIGQLDTTTGSLTLEDIDEVLSSKTHNNWLEDSAGVIGTQEVYNDPRQRIVKAREQTNADVNIEKMSFQEKLKMFNISAKK